MITMHFHLQSLICKGFTIDIKVHKKPSKMRGFVINLQNYNFMPIVKDY